MEMVISMVQELTRIRKKTKRDKFFKIRLLPSEVTELKELAKSENLDPSKFVRSRIFFKNIAA
jgi:hypothetical protein